MYVYVEALLFLRKSLSVILGFAILTGLAHSPSIHPFPTFRTEIRGIYCHAQPFTSVKVIHAQVLTAYVASTEPTGPSLHPGQQNRLVCSLTSILNAHIDITALKTIEWGPQQVGSRRMAGDFTVGWECKCGHLHCEQKCCMLFPSRSLRNQAGYASPPATKAAVQVGPGAQTTQSRDTYNPR